MEAIFSAAVVSMMLAAISHWLLLRKVKESQWFLAQRSIEHIEDQGKRTWDNCAQLWDRNAEDRKLIGELRERVEELEAKVTGEKTVVWNYHPGMSDEEKSTMIEEMRMAMKCSGKFSPRAPLY